MIIDYDSFATASTLIHTAQGAALLALGLAEAYTLDHPGRRAGFIGPVAFLAVSVAIPLLALALPGGWDTEQLRTALTARRGFHLFMAMALLFCAAGLSRLTQVFLGREGGGWQAAFLVFLGFIGVLYFLVASRVNEEAWRQVMTWHAAAGSTLLLAVIFKAAHALYGRRAMHLGWSALLIVAALQLAAYRESPATFGARLLTFESSSRLPPVTAVKPVKGRLPKNAGTADKKRPGN